MFHRTGWIIMKRHVWESSKTVAANIGFVLLLAITGIFISGSSILFILFPAILSFIVQTVTYGRLAEIIQERAKEPYSRLYKRHWVNYFKVQMVMLIPFFIALIILKMSNPLGKEINLQIAGSVIGVLSIYINPYIFLKQEGTLSIKYGISFLVRNLAGAVPLIAFIWIIFMVKLFVHKEVVQISRFLFNTVNIYSVVSIGFMQNLITVFIGLVVFVTACRILVGHGAFER